MLQDLKTWCEQNGVGYAHARHLAADGLLPVVHMGRRLFVHLPTAEAWAKAGGAALPGGWRREPKAEAAGGAR